MVSREEKVIVFAVSMPYNRRRMRRRRGDRTFFFQFVFYSAELTGQDPPGAHDKLYPISTCCYTSIFPSLDKHFSQHRNDHIEKVNQWYK
ncbi:hypothetical protein VTN00DRAFT_4249 [Thermoascus crustaceus]|uniref:uncharacterized protein n=1 Tax=Thermoascus crustaceus TaxID=5088 RepID=UPI003743567E